MSLIKKEGLIPLFFIRKYSNLKYFPFINYRLLKEQYFDTFTIDLKYINGKFNLGINR